MRYYIHVKDGQTILDEEGAEFSNLDAVKNNAIRASGEMVRSLNHGENFWSGEPWKLWVTDGPNSTGKSN